jgi:hypothetical protein
MGENRHRRGRLLVFVPGDCLDSLSCCKLLINFVEVNAKRCTGFRGSFFGDMLDNGLDMFVFSHVGSVLLVLLFKSRKNGVRDITVTDVT